MAYRITFLPGNRTIEVEDGCTILQAQIKAGLQPDAPCGGKGTCGKCRVAVISGPECGSCLACQTKITGDMTVQLPYSASHQVLRDHYLRPVSCHPGVSGMTLPVVPPSLEDPRSDWERLQAAAAEVLGCQVEELPPSLTCLTSLHQVLVESGYTP